MGDHLFFPAGEPPKPLKIQYNGPFYDGGPWGDYPARNDFSIDTKFDPLLVECWLYFGTLHHVFGDKLHQKDFLRYDTREHKRYITTERLPDYVGSADWHKNDRSKRVFEIVKQVCDQLTRKSVQCSIMSDMLLAIRLLCYSLWDIAERRAHGRTGLSTCFGSSPLIEGCLNSPDWEPRSYKLLIDELLSEGWCPNEIEKISFGSLALYCYLAQLPRPGLFRSTHIRCDKNECLANQVNESFYISRHVQEDCPCLHLHVDQKKLQSILLEGGIPLVQMTSSGRGDLKMEIIKKHPGKRYVAFSHVWSHGLGNAEGNSLPSCQVDFLYNQASALLNAKEHVPRYEGAFSLPQTGAAQIAHAAGNMIRSDKNAALVWIDTLCVPHRPDVRKLAIRRISEVYLDAYRTLVIDSELMEIVSKHCGNLEILLRVLTCSSWVRRLWTLQEGIAAKRRLYVLFSDRIINIATIADHLLTMLENKIHIFHRSLAVYPTSLWFRSFKFPVDFGSWYRRLFHREANPFGEDRFLRPTLSRSDVLQFSWFNVATRTTSKDEDRPVILAGILNLGLEDILQIKTADARMLKLYSILGEFPQGVIFLEGARFDVPGWRWALKSCRYTTSVRFLTGESGKILPCGLEITQYPSFIYQPTGHFDQPNKPPVVQCLDGLSLDRASNRQRFRFIWVKPTSPFTFPEANREFGIMFQDDPFRTSRGLFSDSVFYSSGAIVSLQRTEGFTSFARFEYTVHIYSIPDGTQVPSQDGYILGISKDKIEHQRIWYVG